MELLIGAVVVLFGLWLLAPRFAGPGGQPRSDGLRLLQTLCALAGIVLVAEWYVVEQPDAARLKFDQQVTAAPLDDGRGLVNIEVTIANVGGHESRFDALPYKVFVQQIAPDPADLPPEANGTAPNGVARVWRADNWPALAYRAVGRGGESKAYPNWDIKRPDDDGEAGLKTTIQPNETEHLYFAAAVPCAANLHLAVSSRFRRPRTFADMVAFREAEWWIKQSYLDLTDVCRAAGKTRPDALENGSSK